MDMPPSRYRVEERGRRLVVIDRDTGREVSPTKSPLPLAGEDGNHKWPGLGKARHPSPRASGMGTQGWRFGIQGPKATPDSFVTQRWFDARAPRTIKLNYAARARLAWLRFGGAIVIALLVASCFLFWPWFPFAIAATLAPQRSRSQLREASTRWLDGFDQAD